MTDDRPTPSQILPPEAIEALFTDGEGRFLCARWGRPLAPVVFGVQEDSIAAIKGAFEALCSLCGHQMSETDPELGANLMIFFMRDWGELLDLPDLDRMIGEVAPLVSRLHKTKATQYRMFRFDAQGAIKACFVFLRMDTALMAMPAQSLALAQGVEAMLSWASGAFAKQSPLASLPNGDLVLRPDIAALMRAAYSPNLPDCAVDASHALRLYARCAK